MLDTVIRDVKLSYVDYTLKNGWMELRHFESWTKGMKSTSRTPGDCESCIT